MYAGSQEALQNIFSLSLAWSSSWWEGVGGVGVWAGEWSRFDSSVEGRGLLLRPQCRAATDWLPASSTRHGHRYTKPAPPRYTGQLAGTEHTGYTYFNVLTHPSCPIQLVRDACVREFSENLKRALPIPKKLLQFFAVILS